MKKLFLTFIILLFSFVFTYANVYFRVGNLTANTSETQYVQNVFFIGSRNTYRNNNFELGYDSCYISPKFQLEKNIMGFDNGYASYDCWISIYFKNFKLKLLHNCTHKFTTGSLLMYYNDMSTTSLELEYAF